MAVTLALIELSELSMLDDELERERLEAWFAVTLALMELSELSMLDDEFERLRLDA